MVGNAMDSPKRPCEVNVGMRAVRYVARSGSWLSKVACPRNVQTIINNRKSLPCPVVVDAVQP